MVSPHSSKFGGHRHCGSGDIMFAKEENSRCSHFKPPLLFIFKGHGLKAQAYHIINSNPGHTCSKQQLDKYLKITFVSPSKSTDEKEKKKKKKRKAIAKCFALNPNGIIKSV